jgi:arsenate reductase
MKAKAATLRRTNLQLESGALPSSNVSKEAGMAKTKAVMIFGIKNCDTMKKARSWLGEHGIAYTFHDYKAEGIDDSTLRKWAGEVGWQTLLNRAGTTFRKLPEAKKEGIGEKQAIALMASQPSMIKRPVLDVGGKLLVGFDPAAYKAALL